MYLVGVKAKLSGPAEKATTALRYEQFGDLDMAERRFQELKKEADQPGQRTWFLLAARKAEQIKPDLGGNEKPEEKREKLVKDAVARAEMGLQTHVVDARAACLNVIALYGNDEKLKGPVDKARELLKKTTGR